MIALSAQILPIARNAFVESVRQPVLVIMLLIGALLQTMNTWIIGFTMGRRSVPGEVTGDNKLLLDVSLATIFVLGIILASFIATSAISREIENKTILTVVSKPVGRVSVILGKYIGIACAMIVAALILIAMMLLAIRHGVQETAADDPDLPVILFGFAAVFGAVFLGGIANFLYNWSFAQTSSLLMLPMVWIAYLGVLLLDDEWAFQPIGTDFKPQIMLASACLIMALLVMTSIAAAVSTRVGQVVTILIGAIVFLLGLMSNHMIGRHVFINESVAQIAGTYHESGLDLYDFQRDRVYELAARRNNMTLEEFSDLQPALDPRGYVDIREVLAMGPVEDPRWSEVTLRVPGSELAIDLLGPPSVQLEVGDSFYYGATPNGVGLVTPSFKPVEDGTPIEAGAREAPALVIKEIQGNALIVQQIGETALPLSRPPLPRDFIYLKPTRVNPVALSAWSLIPNMQSFWLVDAITKNAMIPFSHVGLVFAYSLCQIVVFLALAVALFQGRDVG
jgi:hypothetical protein